MDAEALQNETKSDRLARLGLAGRASPRQGDLAEQDRWLLELAVEAESRASHLFYSLKEHGPRGREPRLLVRDLATVVGLLQAEL
jgi:hypothetical protein